jgi:hypothetical protein
MPNIFMTFLKFFPRNWCHVLLNINIREKLFLLKILIYNINDPKSNKFQIFNIKNTASIHSFQSYTPSNYVITLCPPIKMEKLLHQAKSASVGNVFQEVWFFSILYHLFCHINLQPFTPFRSFIVSLIRVVPIIAFSLYWMSKLYRSCIIHLCIVLQCCTQLLFILPAFIAHHRLFIFAVRDVPFIYPSGFVLYL